MVEVSNADRVVFPKDGITKGQVVDYYQTVGNRMLPFIAGRALTVERYPRGIGEKGFMQKNAPDHLDDDLIGRHEVPKEEGGTTVYPVVDTVDGIAAFANLGVITFHAPPSTVVDEWHPDWLIWDIDPPEARFDLARAAAKELRAMLADRGIPTLLMTSGSKGYHLRSRIEPNTGSEDCALIARGVAALGVAENESLLTLAFRKADRGERVFVDWLRNAPYSTSAVPWSLRARDGAPVAAPISWEEIESVDPDGITLDMMGERQEVGSWTEAEPVDVSGKPEEIQHELDDAGIELEPFDRFRS